MNIDQAFPSTYLKSDDVVNPTKVTIVGCVIEEVGPDKEKRPILVFKPSSKFPNHERPSIVLNQTNANIIKGAYGSDTNAWTDKVVGLWVDPNVQFGKQMVKGLRIKVFQPEPSFDEPQQYEEEQKATAQQPDFNDDIPFGDD